MPKKEEALRETHLVFGEASPRGVTTFSVIGWEQVMPLSS